VGKSGLQPWLRAMSGGRQTVLRLKSFSLRINCICFTHFDRRQKTIINRDIGSTGGGSVLAAAGLVSGPAAVIAAHVLFGGTQFLRDYIHFFTTQHFFKLLKWRDYL